MNTVTIYKVECTKAYQMNEQGTGYSLTPWGNNTDHYEGDDDGGRLYTLPEGYTVAQCNSDTNELYDEQGKHCSIVMHSSGLPEVVSTTRRKVLNLNLGLDPEKKYVNPISGTVQTGEAWQADCNCLGADALDCTWNLEEVS